MSAVIVVVYILLLFLLIVVFLILLLLLRSAITTKVPFVSIPEEILSDVVNALNLKLGSVVYDLGCGDCRVLLECWKSFPDARYIGVDKDIIPVCTAYWRIRKAGKPPIEIMRRNFFDVDISSATHIFVCLFPWMLDKLLPKFKNELRHGTRLVSCDYRFTSVEPIKEIDLNRENGLLGRRLYVYEF